MTNEKLALVTMVLANWPMTTGEIGEAISEVPRKDEHIVRTTGPICRAIARATQRYSLNDGGAR